MKAQSLAKWERRMSSALRTLSPRKIVDVYSKGRLNFLEKLKEELPDEYTPPKELERMLWGIKFRSPIMNAAGMFKNGECYELTARQGAAAYLAGTTTANARKGNEKEGVYLPFIPYRDSNAASNWLGLPNEGDKVVAGRLSKLDRRGDCPMGASVMGSPDLDGEAKLEGLMEGMIGYEKTGVDFIEINESCPNTKHARPQEDKLYERLSYIRRNLPEKGRKPTIVKFSNDTQIEQVDDLVYMLVELGFDGVNFGNSSILYEKRKVKIAKKDQELFKYFTETFGGGITGLPLREDSAYLAAAAVQAAKKKGAKEFHVIRTGGIETVADICWSEGAGIALNQWFTGYFKNFEKHGHDVYKQIYAQLLETGLYKKNAEGTNKTLRSVK